MLPMITGKKLIKNRLTLPGLLHCIEAGLQPHYRGKPIGKKSVDSRLERLSFHLECNTYRINTDQTELLRLINLVGRWSFNETEVDHFQHVVSTRRCLQELAEREEKRLRKELDEWSVKPQTIEGKITKDQKTAEYTKKLLDLNDSPEDYFLSDPSNPTQCAIETAALYFYEDEQKRKHALEKLGIEAFSKTAKDAGLQEERQETPTVKKKSSLTYTEKVIRGYKCKYYNERIVFEKFAKGYIKNKNPLPTKAETIRAAKAKDSDLKKVPDKRLREYLREIYKNT